MTKVLLHIILLTVLLSCNSNNRDNYGTDLLVFIQDSTQVFYNVEEGLYINGMHANEKMSLHYTNVSKEVFFEAINKNKDIIRYFDSKRKINEYQDNRFNENTLIIGEDINRIYLINLKEGKNHRARNFFLEGKNENFYLIKRIQFEDAETILWNANSGEEHLILFGTSVILKDSIMFYSNTFFVTPEDKNPICFFDVNSQSIDTLFCADTKWFTNFAFFDKDKSSIYYIHRYFDDYKLKATYAKMNYQFHLSD